MFHQSSGRLDHLELASLQQRVTLRSLDGNALGVVQIDAGTSVHDLKQAASAALAKARANSPA